MSDRPHDPKQGTTGGDEEFWSWLPDDGRTQLAYKHEGDRIYALYLEFNIAGTGHSERSAQIDATRLLYAYLHHCFEQDLSFPEARRPVSLSLRVWIRLSVLAAGLVSVVHPRFERLRKRSLKRALSRHAPQPVH